MSRSTCSRLVSAAGVPSARFEHPDQADWHAPAGLVPRPASQRANNLAERALRIIAIGRKNFLFVGHAEGGHNLAVLQSLCSTCLLHGVNPYEYLKDVAVRVQTHPAKRIDELLPWNWKPLDQLDAA